MSFDPAKPYDHLPDLQPMAETETVPVLRQCVKATRALAELKGAGGLIPNQAIIINAIPLQEAKASSEIENILTTQDALFRAAIDESQPTDPQTKEVLRYRRALKHGYESLQDRPLSMFLIRELCSILRGESVDFRQAGQNVFIGNPTTRNVLYSPPCGGQLINDRLANLESYLLASDGPDPLIRMAVGHYQFEAIHPFTDGNGRTGRILNILYLLQTGLLEIPVLYLSQYLIDHKNTYYRLLLEVSSKQAWESWLIFMLEGIEITALATCRMLRNIRDLLDDTIARIRKEIPKVYSKELVELIFHQPYTKIAFVVDAGIARRQTAATYLQALVDIGVLSSETVGRERLFINTALLDLLKKGNS